MLEKGEILDSVVTSLWLKNSILAALTHKVGLDVVDNKDIPACAYTDGKGLYINWAECQKFKDEIKNDAMDVGEKMMDLGHSIVDMGETMLDEAGDKLVEMKDTVKEKMVMAKDEMMSMMGMKDE